MACDDFEPAYERITPEPALGVIRQHATPAGESEDLRSDVPGIDFNTTRFTGDARTFRDPCTAKCPAVLRLRTATS